MYDNKQCQQRNCLVQVMPELLPAPPRAIATLAVHSQRAFRWLCLFFVAAAIGSVVLFWPILIKEDFEAYLQCDGPQHGRLHLLKELKQQQVARAESAEGRQLLAPQERSVAKYFVRLIYATSDGSNIFTEKYLNRIREIESRIRRLPSFQHFCYAEHGRCQPPVSVINYFFASVNHATGAMIPDGRGSKMLPIQAILANLGTSNSYFVDRYFGVSQSQLQSALEGNITRSVLRFGLPLRGFTDVQDPEQFEKFSNFVREELRPALLLASSEELKVFFYGDAITQAEVEATVWHDTTYALGSLLFIFFYLVWYLRSFRLTVMALFCIALSFPISYAFYCLVYGHGKMIAINFLSLFVVLGVGADDVFVLHDVWFLTKCHGTGEMALARRMWSMYCKAGMAIFATSATTAASFFANLFSSIGPLRQFGFFMGTCITVNWVIVATLYPLVLVNHERSIAGGPGCTQTSQDVDVQDEEKALPLQQPGNGRCQGGSKVAALMITILGVAVSLFALTTAVRQLRPSNGVPKFFPQDSNLGGLQDLQMRFGNETGVNLQEMVMCHGRFQSGTHCAVEPRPPPLILPRQPATPIVLPPAPTPQPQSPAAQPARRPAQPASRPAPRPALPPQPAPPTQPRPPTGHLARTGRPTRPTTSPPSLRPLPTVPTTSRPSTAKSPARPWPGDYDVHLMVQGETDPEELEILRAKILSSLKLEPEDLQVEIKAQPKSQKQLRRLGDEFEVTLHFQHLSTKQEQQIKDFLETNQELLQVFGATDIDHQVTSTAAPSTSHDTTFRHTSTVATAVVRHRPTPSKPTTLAPVTTTAEWFAPRPQTSAPTSTLPPLHLQKRGMTKDRQAQVFVLFGFRQVPGGFRYEVDDAFDLSAPQAQVAIVDFCQRLVQQAALKVVPGLWNCWPLKMKEFLTMRGQAWPTSDFLPQLRHFVRESPRWVGDHMDIDRGTAAWSQLDFNVEVDIWSSGRQVQPYMDLWEETVVRVHREVTEKHSSAGYLGTPVPVSDLFQRAEAESRVVNSALSSWLVSVACALIALGIFTQSLWLSGIACFAMLSTAACSLFFITSVFHWSFGLMEAVSLIIFCGFSVDYPLHVVQAYVHERQRGAKVQDAINEVGSAVASGCVTTCGAAVFLLFCQIRIFTRFGQVLVVNMVCSLVFALLWIPAVLELSNHGLDLRQKRAPRGVDSDEGYAMGLLGEGRQTPGAVIRAPERLMLEVDESEGFAALRG